MDKLHLLTDRERQVLQYAVDGQTNKHIARILGLTPKTIEHHRRMLMRKLEIRGTARLVRFAIRAGIISP